MTTDKITCPLCDKLQKLDLGNRIETHSLTPMRALCGGSGMTLPQVSAVNALKEHHALNLAQANERATTAESALARVDRALALTKPTIDRDRRDLRERGFDAAMNLVAIARDTTPVTTIESTRAYDEARDATLRILKDPSVAGSPGLQARLIASRVHAPVIDLAHRMINKVRSLQIAREQGACCCEPTCPACSYHHNP